MQWRVSALALAAVLLAARGAGAEWQIKPSIGFTFAPATTLVGDQELAAGFPVDPELESGSSHLAFGAAAALMGEVLGVEADFAYAPGFYQAREQEILLSSSAQTLTGNVIVALPRRLTQYTLRPYLVAGVGMMRLRSEDQLHFFPIQRTLAAVDFGGGATGFFNERIGVGWDLRHFRSVGGKSGDPLVTVDGVAEKQSFWRANMALVLRY